MRVEEGIGVSEAFRIFTGAVTTISAEMVGYRAQMSEKEKYMVDR